MNSVMSEIGQNNEVLGGRKPTRGDMEFLTRLEETESDEHGPLHWPYG